MAKLKIQAPNGKTLVVDVGDADQSEYDDLAAAALEDYTSKQGVVAAKPAATAPLYSPDQIEKQRQIVDKLEKSGVKDVAAVQKGILDRMESQTNGASLGEQMATIPGAAMDFAHVMNEDVRKPVNREIGAGYAGVADLIAGNGLDKAVENVGNVKDGKDVTSGAAVFGQALGDQVTPEQIVAQAGFGALADLVGPAVMGVLKGWGEKAALNAVGMVKSIAETLNVNLPDLAQFLMKPITLGGKEFAPIVRATSDVSTMTKDSLAIQMAAGKRLEAVASAMDDAINGAIAWAEENSESPDVILDLKAMKPAIEELKEKAVGGLEDVAPDVVQKFDGLITAVSKFAKKQEDGTMATAFSDLSAMKTKLGGVTNFKSGTENNLAMQQAYGVMAKTLNKAADKVGGDVAQSYREANLVYHQVTAIVNALQGKETKFALKDLFAPGAMSLIGTVIGGLPGLVVGAATGAVTNAYGHQAVARGLNGAAPLVGKAIQVGMKALPPIARAIGSSLTNRKADEE